jgi:lysozyme
LEKKTQNIIIVSTIVLLLLIATPASSALEKIIKQFEEGGNAALTAYDDGSGNPTIGFGSTYNYDLGRPVQMGDTITTEQAYKFMRIEIDSVVNDIKTFVYVPLTDNEYYALASLGYNIGTSALRGSTLVRLLNEGTDKATVADQFLVWNKSRDKNSGELVYNQGLYNRRVMERDLFLS